uniref:Uncharacterized protein n=1 Tax=Rhizophora mucronata TaxID=61149 RepID=A0A2P2MHC6_RHIMU
MMPLCKYSNISMFSFTFGFHTPRTIRLHLNFCYILTTMPHLICNAIKIWVYDHIFQ